MAARRLLMTFKNEAGGKVSITVDNAKESLTPTEVSQAMASIIANNIFTSRGGNLVEALGATLVAQEAVI